MFRRSIVRVDHVAGTASAGAVVAGMIVGAGKRQQRIEQSSLLQPEKYWIGAQLGTEAALAELDLRLARIFFETQDSRPPASSLPPRSKTRKHVAGLRNLPTLQRIEIRAEPFLADLLGRRRWKRHQSPRRAIGPVALAESRRLQWERPLL